MAKKTSRRKFIEKGITTGLVLPFLGTSLLTCNSNPQDQSQSKTAEAQKSIPKLNILILGGTSFLGPHQVAYALGRGHSVSTFTRGKTQPSVHRELFKEVEQLIGDREDDLSALQDRKWDAVIDNSGRKVEWTQSTAELLKDNVDMYLYTSSTGVYFPYLGNDIMEDTELVLEEPEVMGEFDDLEYGYGIMKSKSELAAKATFGEDRTLIVRPTYMIGPADQTNRFIHWPIRLSNGGETMVPGKSEDRVQYIDVRDTAEWMIRLLEEKKVGTYNAVGPKETQTMMDFVNEAKGAFEAETSFVQIDDYEFLKENKIYYLVPWIMPEGNNQGSSKVNNQKAINNGLTFRPLTKTIKDTYNWWYSDTVMQEQRDKVEADPKSVLAREKEILELWKVAQAAK